MIHLSTTEFKNGGRHLMVWLRGGGTGVAGRSQRRSGPNGRRAGMGGRPWAEPEQTTFSEVSVWLKHQSASDR